MNNYNHCQLLGFYKLLGYIWGKLSLLEKEEIIGDNLTIINDIEHKILEFYDS